jgi:hypothetical protein
MRLPRRTQRLSVGGQRGGAVLVAILYCIFLGAAITSSAQEHAFGMTIAYDDSSRLWLVTDVVPFGEAGAAGVRVGDMLKAIDSLPPGATAPLAVDRAYRLTFSPTDAEREISIERYTQNPDGASP